MSQHPSKQTILIVDDEPINIRALELVLGGEHDLVFATSGEAALEMAQSDPQPDLILMDIVMPGHIPEQLLQLARDVDHGLPGLGRDAKTVHA